MLHVQGTWLWTKPWAPSLWYYVYTYFLVKGKPIVDKVYGLIYGQNLTNDELRDIMEGIYSWPDNNYSLYFSIICWSTITLASPVITGAVEFIFIASYMWILKNIKRTAAILPLLVGWVNVVANPNWATDWMGAHINNTKNALFPLLEKSSSYSPVETGADSTLIDRAGTKVSDTGNPNKPGVIDPPHEDIVKMSFDSILKKYPSNGMEMIRQHFLIEINKQRAALGNPWLRLNDTINALAQEQAKEMWDSLDFSHKSRQWKTALSRALADGRYDVEIYGSNISCNIATIDGVIQSYINNHKWNTSHYRIIDTKAYQDLWVWVAQGKDWLFNVVVNYGKQFSEK